MDNPNVELSKIIGMAVGAVILGIIPTLILDWLDLWPHFPALLFAILGAAVYFLKESSDSEFADKIQAENKSNALGFLLGAAALVPFGAWVADDGPDAVAPQVPTTPVQKPTVDERRAEGPQRKAVVETDIDELLTVYERNQIEGLQKFGNATLKISGKVVRVRESFGTGILILQSQTSGAEMELSFSERGTPKLGSLMPSAYVVATCPGASEAMGEIFLGSCSDVEVID